MAGNDAPGRVALRPIAAGDQDEFLALARASAGRHHPWYSMPVTPEEFQAYLARYAQPATEG
jgi:[ribosomal protein S5]-alanine N-acetyltransferase